MDHREAMAALDKAITKLEVQAESDEDMALALEVVQAERAETEFDGEFSGAEPREPVRKEVAAIASGSGALLVIAVGRYFGLEIDLALAAAIAGGVGAFGAWLKSESFFVG